MPSFLIGNANAPFWTQLYALFSNFFFFGVEVLPFFGEENWKFVLGPVWSLSIECYFYALAPFIVRRRLHTLLALTCIALAFRLSLYLSGVPMLPWRYFFFPAHLVFFLMGSLSYHFYVWLQGKAFARWLGAGAVALLIACVVSPPVWTAPDLDQPLSWSFYVCVWVCTPLVFNLTHTWKFDNALGQMSYPIYLSHALVIGVVQQWGITMDNGVVGTALTLAFSAGLYAFLDRPIEHIRRRIGVS
jgi:peptidoglycan/LPS O-acetylase OafA/YrhL